MTEYKIIRLKDITEMTGLKRSSIYALMKEERFPQSVSLGSRSVGWVLSEINDWILERMNERN